MKTGLLLILLYLATGLISPEVKERPISEIVFVKDDSQDMDVRKAEREFSKAKQEYQIEVIEYGNKKASR